MKFTQTNRTIRDGLRRLKDWVDKQNYTLWKHNYKNYSSVLTCNLNFAVDFCDFVTF